MSDLLTAAGWILCVVFLAMWRHEVGEKRRRYRDVMALDSEVDRLKEKIKRLRGKIGWQDTKEVEEFIIEFYETYEAKYGEREFLDDPDTDIECWYECLDQMREVGLRGDVTLNEAKLAIYEILKVREKELDKTMERRQHAKKKKRKRMSASQKELKRLVKEAEKMAGKNVE